jgi:hypothetical protein
MLSDEKSERAGRSKKARKENAAANRSVARQMNRM